MDREVTLDLDRGDIRKAFWGYNRSEVHQLLRLMQDQLQNAKRRIVELEGQLSQKELQPAVMPSNAQATPPTPQIAEVPVKAVPVQAPVDPTDQVEVNLREIFIMAQKTADDTRAKAEREAAVMLDEARHKAEEQTREFRAEASQLKWDIERLRLDKQKLVDEYKVFLESRLASLSDAARAFMGTSSNHSAQMHVHPIVTPEEARALLDDKRDAS